MNSMVGKIMLILLGLLIWKIVPGWIEYGNKKTRESIRLGCNIAGIALVIIGLFSLLMSILNLIQL